MSFKRVVFLGVGEVGNQALLHLVPYLSAEQARKYSYILVDGDRVERRNPSYRTGGWGEGVYKVAAAGYSFAAQLGLRLVSNASIPLLTPDGMVVAVPKFVTCKEMEFALRPTDLLVESSDQYHLQNLTGLHVHTGLLFDRPAFTIQYGKFNRQAGNRNDPDCPELLGFAAMKAGERAAEIIAEIVTEKKSDFLSLYLSEFVQ